MHFREIGLNIWSSSRDGTVFLRGFLDISPNATRPACSKMGQLACFIMAMNMVILTLGFEKSCRHAASASVHIRSARRVKHAVPTKVT